MATPVLQPLGSFSVGRKTATAGTAIATFVPPYGGSAVGVGSSGVPGGGPGQKRPLKGVIHVTSLIIDSGSTVHSLAIMRPLNYTTFSAVAAAAQAVVAIQADPGIYSTNYQYPLANGVTAPSPADNAIAAGDYVVYQAADGHWVLDTVASVSGLNITMTGNLPTGGVIAGGLFYCFGISTDTQPYSNAAHQLVDTTATARVNLTDPNGLFQGYQAGDPLVVFDANATAADTLQLIAGFYADR